MELIGSRRQLRENVPAAREPRWAVVLRKAYGPAENFLTLFNPSIQDKAVQNPRKVYSSSAPSLARVRVAYGLDIATSWMALQLRTVCEAMPGSKTPPAEMLTRISRDIACDEQLSTLKVPEIMLFLARFRAGAYGKLYGALTEIDLCAAMREFMCGERAAAVDGIRKEEEREERNRALDGGITWEEFCRRKGIVEKSPLEWLQQQCEGL